MKNSILLLIFGATMLLVSCGLGEGSDVSPIKKGMVKVTILYLNEEGKTFDMEYYANNHMPMVADLFGESLKKFEIDKGISGRTPEDATPYVALGYLYFDTLADYQEAFGSHGSQILEDIPNYTDIQPMIQISEVVQ
ncbi:MAG: ethyl tert-butyl ether degradation protein EthD [Flavobacteriaceae bacterium]|nr:MAG: ethyl tert-butyl ether degradation protein EthD [Flavobacteriaceae bacterium]